MTSQTASQPPRYFVFTRCGRAVISIERDEEWRTAPGYDDYEVSNLGRVRSRDRVRTSRWGANRKLPGRILLGTSDAYGRRFVCLRWRTNSPRRVAVHRIVLAAFVGPCPQGMEGCHNDGDASNNHLDNLRYDTHQANVDDRHRHGTVLKGERHPGSKLSAETVRAIRKACANGVLQNHAALLFGVSKQTVNYIVNRKLWRHV